MPGERDVSMEKRIEGFTIHCRVVTPNRMTARLTTCVFDTEEIVNALKRIFVTGRRLIQMLKLLNVPRRE